MISNGSWLRRQYMNPAFSAAAAFELGKWEESRLEREKLLKRANSTRASKTGTSKQFE
jgi:hypothetical protein